MILVLGVVHKWQHDLKGGRSNDFLTVVMKSLTMGYSSMTKIIKNWMMSFMDQNLVMYKYCETRL